jgi:exosortase
MRLPPLVLPKGCEALLLALLLAMWPVWQWIAWRAIQGAADAWALLSLVTAAAFLWRDRASVGLTPPQWGASIALLLIYAVTFPFAPPLIRAIVAMSVLAAACSAVWYGRRMDVRLWGLLLLSVPLIPSLSFYLGYPLRVAVGEATAVLLQLNGFAATRDGTILLWNGKQISIDAPCSGIKMLWTGLYLSCALAALMRLNTSRTFALVSLGVAIVMMANVLRATALFYVEAGVVPQGEPAHASIGVVVFALAAMLIATSAARLRGPMHAV